MQENNILKNLTNILTIWFFCFNLFFWHLDNFIFDRFRKRIIIGWFRNDGNKEIGRRKRKDIAISKNPEKRYAAKKLKKETFQVALGSIHSITGSFNELVNKMMAKSYLNYCQEVMKCIFPAHQVHDRMQDEAMDSHLQV